MNDPLASLHTLDAIAMSYAAYRLHNSHYVSQTRRFSEDLPTIYCNKDIVSFSIYSKCVNRSWRNLRQFIPDDFASVEVTSEDIDNAKEARRWVKRYVMLGLGDIAQSTRSLVSIINSETFTKSSISKIAFIPEFIKRDKQRASVVTETANTYADSVHIGKPGKSLHGCFRTLYYFYNKQLLATVYIGAVNNSLVVFTCKNVKNIKYINAADITITAKIQSHRIHQSTVNITSLSEVILNKGNIKNG